MFLSPLLILFVSASQPVDWWERIPDFIDDPANIPWDVMGEEFGVTHDDGYGNEGLFDHAWDEYTPRNGILSRLPDMCKREMTILSGAELSIVLREILRTGVVPTLPEMVRVGGVRRTTDPRYKSLHNAVRMLNRRLGVSLPALQAMLTLRNSPDFVTESEFTEYHRSYIEPIDPRGSSKCDLLIWYYFVINSGTRIRDLEVTESMSRDGYTFFQPVGSTLRRLVEFELGRIQGPNSVDTDHP